MSKVNAIKNMKRQQKVITPTQALAASVGEEDLEQEQEQIEPAATSSNQPITVSSSEENFEPKRGATKVDRKRVSFDLRTDLHKELKLQALMQEKNIYILIEEALEQYLKENK
ncbi:hypothetical protein [Bacillus massiliigorillae]|uniref:hypothetical protein n=1 Tax=Bacillus massiliigorillae TaxID=1243664 RepID=UPI00039A4734|nr:hypothetical protein [Bacillus massiliigorillae]